MRNFETTERTLDRRRFLTAAGLSMIALAGCGTEPEAKKQPIAQVPIEAPKSTSMPGPAIELVSYSPEQLRDTWQEIIKKRSGNIDVAIFDSTNGQSVQTSNVSPEFRFKTASIIKLSILERLLMTDPVWARDNENFIRPMITISDNATAESLWNHVGGASKMQEHFGIIGANNTVAAGGGGLFATMTTAADQVKVASAAAYPGIMRPDDVDFAKNLMHQVVNGQRWGISAGLPPDVTYENKNGWVGARRNSIGHIQGHGQDYTIAVLTDNGPGDGYDIDTIEQLSAATWQTLAR